ncbi:MAG: hypothetical protein RR206_04935 [Bacteroidaceae bacterium]
MGKNCNWSADEDAFLRTELEKHSSLAEIAHAMNKSQTAVYLYCYRHFIPLRQQVKKPLMRLLITVKFGSFEIFKVNRDFQAKVNIGQKRWSALFYGYAQPTQDELMRVARAINFSKEDTLKLLDVRQLDLFEDYE